MQQKQVYYKSDFAAILEFDGGWLTPFKLKFWTNSPSRSFIASFDGTTYTNCSVLDDGRLLIAFDSHNMGLGTLMLQPEFYLSAEEYADGVCNEVVTPFAPTFVDTDGTEYTLALSLTGSSTLETVGTLPAYYKKGDQGETGAAGKDGLTTAVKVNGTTYTQVDGVVDLGDIGGGSGTSDYEKLKNKPQIGGVELVGNKTLSEIGVAAESHTHTKSEITDFPESMPASDVSDWAKASEKPTYSASEIAFGESNVETKVSQIQQNVAYLGEPESGITPDVPDIEAELKGLVGTEATSVADGKVLGGMRYTITLSEADDTLEITEIEVSNYETIIYLSIGADVEEPVVLPDSYKSVGTPSFESGKDYVISVLNGILVSGEVTSSEEE